MSNEYKTVHEFDFNLICDFFSNMERQEPGSPDVTLKALSFIDNLTEQSRIADIFNRNAKQLRSYTASIKGTTAILSSSQKR